MEIDDKHINHIINSLEYSIRYMREYHEKIASEFRKERGQQYAYDYENESIQPLKDALKSIKNNLKKRDESKSKKH